MASSSWASRAPTSISFLLCLLYNLSTLLALSLTCIYACLLVIYFYIHLHKCKSVDIVTLSDSMFRQKNKIGKSKITIPNTALRYIRQVERQHDNRTMSFEALLNSQKVILLSTSNISIICFNINLKS